MRRFPRIQRNLVIPRKPPSRLLDRIARAVEELTSGEGLSNREAAEVLGVDERTVRRDRNGDAANAAPGDEESCEEAGVEEAPAANAAPTPAEKDAARKRQ